MKNPNVEEPHIAPILGIEPIHETSTLFNGPDATSGVFSDRSRGRAGENQPYKGMDLKWMTTNMLNIMWMLCFMQCIRCRAKDYPYNAMDTRYLECIENSESSQIWPTIMHPCPNMIRLAVNCISTIEWCRKLNC